ncbi:translation factor Sua5 [Thermocladium modestius]|uniref:Threonylcarbamoyl-AMP synthase n=1 Tax=Thermocladium modestius TaxID=62609 RepID=A0A830GT23_9CREN|nr:L-threonylcarbamoyladenylate synthase [Thermocladium modestius]GGP20100.1 translation factor Sua5 [Thermocladium modestius]
MDTLIIRPNESIEAAAETILRGGLVAFPTETVYGLGADAFNPAAVRRIYQVKGRPADNPSIVHIASLDQLVDVAVDVPDELFKALRRVWPGPFTVVLRKSSKVPPETTGGRDTVAVRMPAHPIALELIRRSRPIAAPSANLSGKPSPTSAIHVIRDLMGKVDAIIDGGDTYFGVESTVIDFTRRPPVLLRPGPFTVEEIRGVIGDIVVPEFARGTREADVALAPGMKYRHYAPSKPLFLVECGDVEAMVGKAKELVERLKQHEGKRAAVLCSSETCGQYAGVTVVDMGHRGDLYEVARKLFAALRLVDDLDVDVAVAEGFPELGIGLAIMNRLRKASGFSIIKCGD